MSRVFVVQKHLKLDEDGNLVPKFDFSAAEKFGHIEYLLGPSASPFNVDNILDDLHEKLSDFSTRDFILLVGNPVFIGLATAVAASYAGGNINLLQWSGKDRGYIVLEAKDVFGDFAQE